jgi:hypothetical protein
MRRFHGVGFGGAEVADEGAGEVFVAKADEEGSGKGEGPGSFQIRATERSGGSAAEASEGPEVGGAELEAGGAVDAAGAVDPGGLERERGEGESKIHGRVQGAGFRVQRNRAGPVRGERPLG